MPEPTEEELQILYRDLAAAGKPALLFLVPGYSDEYVPLSEKEVLPKTLADLSRRTLEASPPPSCGFSKGQEELQHQD